MFFNVTKIRINVEILLFLLYYEEIIFSWSAEYDVLMQRIISGQKIHQGLFRRNDGAQRLSIRRRQSI